VTGAAAPDRVPMAVAALAAIPLELAAAVPEPEQAHQVAPELPLVVQALAVREAHPRE